MKRTETHIRNKKIYEKKKKITSREMEKQRSDKNKMIQTRRKKKAVFRRGETKEIRYRGNWIWKSEKRIGKRKKRLKQSEWK